MTKLLDAAIERVRSLPDEVQDEAAEVLRTIASREEERLRPRKAIDVEMLRALRSKLPKQSESAGDFIRKMRDNDRY